MATKSEQQLIRSALDNVRQTIVRVSEVSERHPRVSREADYGDIAANAVMAYFDLLDLLEGFHYTMAVQIAMADLPYLNRLKSDGLWPDESLLKNNKMNQEVGV